MNFFDSWILSHLNVFARKSWVFDQAVAFLSVNYLLKGGVLMIFLWWAWFRSDDRASKEREHIIVTMLSCVVAIAVGRMMVILLPFRLRPLHEMGLNFLTPYGVSEDALAKLSSFPSDHAVLFFALVTGLFFISRVIGTVALIYTIVVVALPRMYLGLHYPTDILAGAAVGVVIAWIGNTYFVGNRSVLAIKDMAVFKPMYFYPGLFLVTYQVADMFENSRALVGGFYKLGKTVVSAAGMG
jgi:undecaprenyl-diphosphatase